MILPPEIPELAEILARSRVFSVPLKVPFRGVTERQGVLIEGPRGWGEFAPFVEYSAQEASRWLDSALEAAYRGWPEPVRPHVGVNAIIPALPLDQVRRLAITAEREGFRTVKVKVAAQGEQLGDDVARLRAVREVFHGAIRVDANGGWSVAQAVTAIPELVAAVGELQYVEQPCAGLAELALVRERTGVRIAADESIRRADDPIRAAQAGAVDLVVVKVAPLGGVRRALQVVAAAGVPAVVSSAVDTGVGLAAGIALAGALPTLDDDCGLGTGALLAADVVRPAPEVRRGSLASDFRPRIDAESLQWAQAQVSPDRQTWWRQRITDAWHAGTQQRLARLLADSPS